MILNEKLKKCLRNIIKENYFINSLGIELLDIDVGYAKGKMKYKKELCNPYNSIHGGCLFSFADTIAGIAACSYGKYASTISANTNYLNPALNTDNIYCIANVVRQGKTISVYNFEILDDNNKCLVNGSFTFICKTVISRL